MSAESVSLVFDDPELLDALEALLLDRIDAQHWSDSLLAAMTSGQTIGDDIVVACLHLRGRQGGMPTSGS